DTRRPPSRSAPTRLQHHLLETTPNRILKRSVSHLLQLKAGPWPSTLPWTGEGVMESLGTLFVAADWGVPLVGLLGGVIAVAAITRWRRRAISALEKADEERSV
ncbi:hypothetical protein ACFXPV_39010, partial [Streptomyces sp. NPDC059118]